MHKMAALCFALSMCWIAVHPNAIAQTKAPLQVQFIQTAGSVSFKDGVLSLDNVAPMTAFFSDRPERLTGAIRNDQFAKLWTEGSHSFRKDPPNAVLSVFSPQGRPTQAVLVLNNPRVDGRTISYDVRTLKGDVPALGAESTLFIDSGDAPCYADDDPSYSNYPCWAQNAFSSGR